MSLYNLTHGVNEATFFALPLLGKKPSEYPRFRDCFIDDDFIQIFTRTGGKNRAAYHEANEKMRAIPEFVEDYDDDFDNTYAIFVFAVPEKWRDDYEKWRQQKLPETSQEYQALIMETFPDVADKIKNFFTKENKE